MSKKLLITREEAAKMLDISTRTLDRKVANRLLSIVKKKGRVLFDKNEIENNVNNDQDKTARVVIGSSKKELSVNNESHNLTIILEHVQKEVEKKDRKIHELIYQIGQLQERIKNSVPLLEAKKTENELKINENNLKEDLMQAKISKWVLIFFYIASILGVTIFEIVY